MNNYLEEFESQYHDQKALHEMKKKYHDGVFASYISWLEKRLAAAEARGRWKSIKSDPPPFEEWVFIKTEYDGCFEAKRIIEECFVDISYREASSVSHWLEIPALPEGKIE